MDDREELIRKIELSSSALGLFGSVDADREYRRLAMACHPDQWMGESAQLRDRASKAFLKLRSLRDKPTTKPVSFGKWVVESPIAAGDIADLYQVASTSISRAVLKIARSAKDNDLMEAEISSIKKLREPALNAFHKYIPVLLDNFKASGRRVTILDYAEGISLSEIVTGTGRLDFRHAVWMSNRLLSALGFVHRQGITHGSVLPTHLLYGPECHSMKLVDWCYSTGNRTSICGLRQ